jgi:hypothetical protein
VFVHLGLGLSIISKEVVKKEEKRLANNGIFSFGGRRHNGIFIKFLFNHSSAAAEELMAIWALL